tara:strand:+ start:407 stop:1642 length:1236 start_codon:yes stop_codon:yes gene_type:complete
MLGLGNSLSTAGVIDTFANLKSLTTDGVDDYVALPEVSALQPTAALSVSFWAKPNAWDMTNGNNDDYFIGCVRTGGWGIYLRNSGTQATTMNFIVNVDDDGSGSDGYITATVNEATVEALTGWKHIVATYDGTTAKLYINAGTTGVTNATSAVGAAIRYDASNATPIFLGADANTDTSGLNFYDGLLDEVAFFNTALSSGDITNIYNGGAPNDVSGMSGLIAYYRMFDTVSNDPDEVTVGTEKGIMHDAANPGLAANIWDSTPSTSHLTNYGTNTVAIEDGAYKVTYGNNVNGFALKINDSVTGTTSEDLVIGAWYKAVTEWKLEGGSVITPRVFAGVNYNQWAPTLVNEGDGFVGKIIYFKANHATSAQFSIASNLGSGETAYLKVTSVQKLNGYPAIAAAQAASSTDVP